MKTRQFIGLFFFFFLSASLTLAQKSNLNQQAVDTLTTEVARTIFSNLDGDRAEEIYKKLIACGSNCKPQQIIRSVGGWNPVSKKLNDLSSLKSDKRFLSMSSTDANAAIRQEFDRFYNKYKADNNYGKPLNPAAQAKILTKISRMFPPTAALVTDSANSKLTVDGQPNLSANDPTAEKKPENQYWMILLSAIAGLLGGAAAVYFLLFKKTKAEADRLRFENSQLSRSLEMAQRIKPVNERRQPQDIDRQKANAYDILLAELGTDIDPLEAIRQLKAEITSESTTGVDSEEPIDESMFSPEPAPVQNRVKAPAVQPLAEERQVPAKSEVFYFPPPDPSGQFDIAQKASTLSPESAYRFSVSAENPSVASFRFEAEPGRVARFMTYRNYMIEPACDSENSYSASYSRVAMRRDGEAMLENGVWRVTTKALIRYE